MSRARRSAARNPSRRSAPPALAESLVRSAALPWFPFSEGIHLKLCRASLATGQSVLLMRAEPGATLGAHCQHGVVITYTIAGTWRYRADDGIVGPGDVVVEPAGSQHAFEVVGDRAVEAFVHLTGALEFLDAAGKTLAIENAETLHGRYLAHCALHGLAPLQVASR